MRVAWCGTDNNHEKDGELIANDILNLVAIGEAAGELLDQAHEAYAKKDAEIKRLRQALDQAVYGCSIRMSRDHDDEIEFAAGLSFGATPELAAYLEGKENG